MASDGTYELRVYESSDLEYVASFVDRVGAREHSVTIRAPAYYDWIALQRPGADRVGPFIVEAAQEIVGFGACRDTGEVLDLAVSHETDVPVVTRMLLEAIEERCTELGAKGLLVNVATVREDIRSVVAELGYIPRVNRSLEIGIAHAPGLLEGLLKDVDHSLPPFDLSLRSPYAYQAWEMHVDGQVIHAGLADAVVNIEIDTQALGRILFGGASAGRALIGGDLRVRPLSATLQVLRLLNTIGDSRPRSFSRSEIL